MFKESFDESSTIMFAYQCHKPAMFGWFIPPSYGIIHLLAFKIFDDETWTMKGKLACFVRVLESSYISIFQERARNDKWPTIGFMVDISYPFSIPPYRMVHPSYRFGL